MPRVDLEVATAFGGEPRAAHGGEVRQHRAEDAAAGVGFDQLATAACPKKFTDLC